MYSGYEDSLHFLSKFTAAGDEIGWEYINNVMNSQYSLSCFCNVKDAAYKMAGSKVSFMSRQTFTDWIFSWMVNFRIDFRKTCSLCGSDPDMLAADATKIGIFFRNSSVEPIEKPEVTTKRVPLHKRNDRIFFHYSLSDKSMVKEGKRNAREDLAYFVAKNSSSLKEYQKKQLFNKKSRINISEAEKRKTILEHAPSCCYDVMEQYLGCTLEQTLVDALNPVFQVCASNVPLTSFINYRFLPLIEEITSKVGSDIEVSFLPLRENFPEIFKLYTTAQELGNSSLKLVNILIKYMAEFIRSVHAHDDTVEECNIVHKYNPESLGRAYYFTPHGGQLRQMPYYETKNEPDDSSQCKKMYPEASKSGTTYLCVIFDPQHYGHCYGFHIIVNSEGRKDVFTPVFLYKNIAPKELFYDFSCQLEEYCLNREPKFWRCCRFWHDVFHGFSHKCPYVYCSKRIRCLESANTEICEQFNAYLQKIKYSGRSMSETHFIFYLQFFIHKWNEERRKEYEKKVETVRKLCS